MSSGFETSFEVRVAKDTFKFNAAHFVAFKGFRERMHGHNYQVSVRLLGSRKIGSDGYVVDFGDIKAVTKKVCKDLNEDKKHGIREAVNHSDTELILKTERSFLKTMDGGCSIPVYGIAHINGSEIHVEGGIISLDGSQKVIKRLNGIKNDPETLGQQLADQVLEDGGK